VTTWFWLTCAYSTLAGDAGDLRPDSSPLNAMVLFIAVAQFYAVRLRTHEPINSGPSRSDWGGHFLLWARRLARMVRESARELGTSSPEPDRFIPLSRESVLRVVAVCLARSTKAPSATVMAALSPLQYDFKPTDFSNECLADRIEYLDPETLNRVIAIPSRSRGPIGA